MNTITIYCHGLRIAYYFGKFFPFLNLFEGHDNLVLRFLRCVFAAMTISKIPMVDCLDIEGPQIISDWWFAGYFHREMYMKMWCQTIWRWNCGHIIFRQTHLFFGRNALSPPNNSAHPQWDFVGSSAWTSDGVHQRGGEWRNSHEKCGWPADFGLPGMWYEKLK